MADAALQVVVDNVVMDIPIVDESIVQHSSLELVKIEKLEPGVIEIEVTSTELEPDEIIVPSNPIQHELVEVVPQTIINNQENVVSVKLPSKSQNQKVASSPILPKDKIIFKPLLCSTPSTNTGSINKDDGASLFRKRTKLLTSSILSTDEIVKEVIARTEKKQLRQLPEGGDLIFQKQLTKRLAEKVVKEETLNRNLSIEMFTPPPAPVLPVDKDHQDLDAQMLLQILEEGPESQYPEPVKPPKVPKVVKTEMDKEFEKELALKQLMEVSNKRKSKENNNNNNNNSKPKKRLKNEVQRLLQDEGAINMLYAMEKGEDAKATALPSKRRMKRALMKKAQEVSQAIMDGSALNKGLRLRHPTDQKNKKDSDDSQEIKNEDNETSTKVEKADFAAPSPTPGASKIIRRHSSSSSYSGNNSPIRRISLDEMKSDGEKDKKIIENGVSCRKKTDSSNTPKALLNVKNKRTKLIKKSLNNSLKSINVKKGSKLVKKKKSLPIEKVQKTIPEVIKPVDIASKQTTIVKDLPKSNENVNETKNTNSKQVIAVNGESAPANSSDVIDQNGFKEKLQIEFTNKLKNMMVRQGLLPKRDRTKKIPLLTPTTSKLVDAKPQVEPQPVSPTKQLLNENKTLTCETIWRMLQDDWDMGDDPDDPPSPGQPSYNDSPPSSINDSSLRSLSLKTEIAPLPTSEPGYEFEDMSSVSSYENHLSPAYSSTTSASSSDSFCDPLNLPFSIPFHSSYKLDVIPENKNEVPFSHQLGSSTYMYKELMLRRIGPLTHVNIAPISTVLPQAFNVQVLKELCSVIDHCKTDSRCKCLLLTSSGSLFSSGVDLPSLLSLDPPTRTDACKGMAQAVKEFAHKLGMFSKMVVTGVSGPCVGLGVGMLPLCDVVLSSPRSIYLTPYSSLGYIPEAAATLTLPAIIGHRMASSMLIGGRKLSAQEAVGCGLVTQVLTEENFASKVLEIAFNIAVQSAQSMESTKAMMMHSVRSRLTTVLAAEAILLQQHWLTHDCQIRIKEKADKLLNE